MSLNLYDLHPDPEKAPDYKRHHDTVPQLVWEKYKDEPKELKKREKALAKDPKIAFLYAKDILQGPFPAGEAAIAKSRGYAPLYAKNVLDLPDAEAMAWPKKLKESLLAELLVLREPS